MGIEPTAQAWEAWVLPLYDARYRPILDAFRRIRQMPRFERSSTVSVGGRPWRLPIDDVRDILRRYLGRGHRMPRRSHLMIRGDYSCIGPC
jgi:hypothetical protein